MIEVLIYRIEDEKLLCGGRTRSLEPSSTRSMTAEIVKEVREALLKDGLIPKPKK